MYVCVWAHRSGADWSSTQEMQTDRGDGFALSESQINGMYNEAEPKEGMVRSLSLSDVRISGPECGGGAGEPHMSC
ncbi:hypothetical protein J6590_044650 [Homalodisca vitripennis]|nr:hypothetical protein J6590_044650 [Homalodisca vitripennis]